MKNWVLGMFLVFATALTISLWVMENVAWALFALFLWSFFWEGFKERKAQRESQGPTSSGPTSSWSFWRSKFRSLALGSEQDRFLVDKALWAFALVVTIGAFNNFESWSRSIDIFGHNRWVVLLYSHAYWLRRFFSAHLEQRMFWPLFGAAVAGVYGLHQTFTGVNLLRGPDFFMGPMGNLWRAYGFFNLPLTYAYAIGMLFFIALAYLIVAGKAHWRKGQWGFGSDGLKTTVLMAALTVPVSFAAVFASGTRGAYLAVLGGLACLPFMMGRRWLLPSFVGMALVLGGLFVALPDLRDRFVSIANVTTDKSNTGRFDIWRGHWAIFKDHYIVGSGLAYNNYLVKYYYEKLGIEDGVVSHAHNNYLQMLAGTGVLGFLAWSVFCLYFLWLAAHLWWKLDPAHLWWRSLALGIFLAQVFHHIGGLTEVNFTDSEVLHQLLLLWAVLVVIKSAPPDVHKAHQG